MYDNFEECHGCTKRYVGCQIDCPYYAARKEKAEAARKKRRMENEGRLARRDAIYKNIIKRERRNK